MATLDGARALGLEKEIGSLEKGKRADVIIVELDKLHAAPRPADIVSALVYSSLPSDVRDVFIEGKAVMRQRELLTLQENRVLSDARQAALELHQRAGLAT